MRAIEFETYVTDPFIELPESEKLMNQRVKVIVLYDRDDCQITSSVSEAVLPSDLKADAE